MASPWEALTVALDELDSIREQLREGRAQERTARFYSLLRVRQVGTEHAGLVGKVIELAGGGVVVQWLHDPKSIALYSSMLSARHALLQDGMYLLSLEDVSERRNPHSRASQTRTSLTPQERRMLLAVSRGLDNQAISEQFTVTMQTVRNTLSVAYHKLGVHNRTAAALLARDLNLAVEEPETEPE